MTSTALGGLLRRPVIGSVGFWMVGSYISIAVGLVVGQILVYRIYRGQVIEESRRYGNGEVKARKHP